jgi:uncharacterized protein (DUF1800 family)
MADGLDILQKRVRRAAIWASDDDKARLGSDGWSGWVDAQLALAKLDPTKDGNATLEALHAATLNIAYEAGEGHGALKEDRKLVTLDAPLESLWHLADWENKMGWEERVRPAREIIAATSLRAATAEAQIRETVVDFWRDHFTVNWEASEDVAVSLPLYDKTLRAHAFGNFREMLEAVASSTAMLSYLNNGSSRASPANENYARELFELHTLGAGAYLNDRFDKWREVPGAEQGKPEGYIDQDVYEAARAFTGWTYAAGQYISEGINLPKTGAFTYTEAWHDPYQKRILAREFTPYTAPLEDGRRVLDLAAFHPATALHVCRKLCQRFVSDHPSDDLVNQAAAVFTEQAKAKDQIAQVIRMILLSQEFADAPDRLQRPLFLAAALQRASGTTVKADGDLQYIVESMGHRVYAWHTPAGHPLMSGYWQSQGLVLRRWRGMQELWLKIAATQPDSNWPDYQSFAQHWSDRLNVDQTHAARLVAFLKAERGEETGTVSFAEDQRWLAAVALNTLSVSPQFQAD